MSSNPSSWRQLAASWWSHSFGSLLGNIMASGDGRQMDTQDEQELQRNREEEDELSEIINLPISDPIGDSFTDEKDLSSLTPELVQSLYSEDVTVQLEAAQKIRKLLLEVPNSLSDEIVKSGAVPRFVSFLEDSRNPELQFESASVLASIASGNSAQTQVIIDAGAVPILIKLLTTSSNETVLEQSVQTLGNIAGDSAEYRDLVLNSNVLPPLLGLFNDDNLSTSLMRKATFTLLNLCLVKNDPPNFEQVSQCLPLLARLIFNQDDEILVNVCWALANLSLGPKEQIQAVIDSGVCPRAVQLLSHTSCEVVRGALCLVCDIAAGDDSQARVLIEENVLPALFNLLFHEKESIVEYACKTLGKITAGNEQQIQSVIESNLIPSLIELLHHEVLSIRQHAAKAIANATENGAEEQIVCIVEAGAIPPLCKFLSEADAGLTEDAVRGLANILRTGELFAKEAGSSENPYATLICNSPEMKLALHSEDSAIQLDATKRFDKLLRKLKEFNSIIDEVIKPGTVPRFVHFLEDSRYPELQFESASVLANIARGNSARRQVVTDAGAVPILSMLLSSPNENVLERSIWALGNIALGNSAQTQVVIESGAVPVLIKLLTSSSEENVLNMSVQALGNIACASTESRALLLNSNVLPPLLGLFNNDNLSLSMIRKITWALVRLCKNSPPNFAQISQCLPLLTRLMVKEDEEVLGNVCQALSRLCEGPDEQIQVVIDSGLCHRSVQLLSHTSNKVVMESASVLANIASGNSAQTQVVIDAGAVAVLIKLLTTSSNETVLEQSVQALGNIARDSTECRNLVLNSNMLPPLLGLFSNGNLSLSMMRKVTWTLARLCKNSSPNFAQVSQCLPLLTRLMVKEDTEVLINVCQALCRLSDGPIEQIQAVIESGVCPRAVQLLSHTSNVVVLEALCLVGDIALGDVSQTQVFINENALPVLCSLLSNEKESIVEYACWALSNIIYDSIDHIQVFIDCGVCPRAVQLLSHTSNEVVKEALRLVCSITAGDASHTQVIINANALPALGSLLFHEEESIVENACLTLANLTFGNKHQIQTLIDANIIPSLIVLLYHRDVKRRNKVVNALANTTANGSVTQIVYLVEAGAIPPLCQLLTETDEDVIEDILICLENIIHTGRGISNSANSTENRFAIFVKQCGGLDKMTFLSSHNDPKIKEKACTLIEKYFA